MTAPTGDGAQAAEAIFPSAEHKPRRQGNLDETLRSFDEVPLFMRNLPSAENNTAIEALQSLAYEGHPDATNFKNQGNEYFRAKRYREALGFYGQALQADPSSASLRESILLNCAACNLELQNYASALHNARDAIVQNPRSVKALYRACKGFLALGRISDARGAVELALGFEPENAELLRLAEQVEQRAAAIERRDKERAERERRRRLTSDAVHMAFLARGLWIEKSDEPPDNPHPAHFDPEALPPYASDNIPLIDAREEWRAPDPIRTPLIFPVMLLYPQYNQSDLIAEYQEDTPIGLHLDAMFPPEARGQLPWDPRGEYVSKNLSVIAATHKGRLFRVGHKLSLREVLDQGAQSPPSGKPEDRDGVVLHDGVLRLYVFPKGTDAERTWVERTKRTKVAV